MNRAGEGEGSSFISAGSPFGRVAVVHDWLTGMRGGESVLEGILDVVPSAEIFTLFHFPGSVSPHIESKTIHTSFLQRPARHLSDYRILLPLFAKAARSFDFSSYELIISSSHAVAKGINALGKPHLCYCHTPMRYIWDRFDDYFPRSRPLIRAAASVLASRLRKWDVRTAAEVSEFVANSTFVRDRISRFYGRDAGVIHPFVEEAFLRSPLQSRREDYHVVVSALVPYKKVDLAIAAAVATGRRLVVIGGGPLRKKLARTAYPNVEIVGPVDRNRIVETIGRARSLILPGIEDFGITPLEAMALGTPVVALGRGGVLDSVIDEKTGIFFDRPEVDSLSRAMEKVEAVQWDRQLLRERAALFSRQRFVAEFQQVLERMTGGRAR